MTTRAIDVAPLEGVSVDVPEGTGAATVALVQRSVETALAARDAQWQQRLDVVLREYGAVVAQDVAQSVYERCMTASVEQVRSDGQRVAELALDVVTQALPDVFATVERSVREATIFRTPGGAIERVVTRTVDTDAA